MCPGTMTVQAVRRLVLEVSTARAIELRRMAHGAGSTQNE